MIQLIKGRRIADSMVDIKRKSIKGGAKFAIAMKSMMVVADLINETDMRVYSAKEDQLKTLLLGMRMINFSENFE